MSERPEEVYALKYHITELEAELEKAAEDMTTLLKEKNQWEVFARRYEADSKRLDKVEQAMRRGIEILPYTWDDEKQEWGKDGFGIDDERERFQTYREAIDKLEEPKL